MRACRREGLPHLTASVFVFFSAPSIFAVGSDSTSHDPLKGNVAVYKVLRIEHALQLHVPMPCHMTCSTAGRLVRTISSVHMCGTAGV